MSDELKGRTKRFALAIMSLAEMLPNTIAGRVVANQLIRSGTSVGANYRAACRGRSDREFISKINIVLEEVDEVCFWLEIIQEKNWVTDKVLETGLKEGNELTGIFVKTLKTMNSKRKS